MCTAMLYDPATQKHDVAKKFAEELEKKPKLYERFMRIKQRIVIKTSLNYRHPGAFSVSVCKESCILDAEIASLPLNNNNIPMKPS